MSPKSNPAPTIAPKPMQDIKPPEPTKNAAPSNTDLIQTEIEHGIPVKQPDQPASGAPAGGSKNPIVDTSQFIQESAQNDTELEKVLKDVNRKVKDADKKVKKRSFLRFKKAVPPEAKPAKTAPSPKSPKPALIATVAVLVAAGLAVAAFYAFRQSESTSSNQTSLTSSNENAGSNTLQEVKPEDLRNLYADVQSKLNSLNDAQDFNSQALSDQSLGL